MTTSAMREVARHEIGPLKPGSSISSISGPPFAGILPIMLEPLPSANQPMCSRKPGSESLQCSDMWKQR